MKPICRIYRRGQFSCQLDKTNQCGRLGQNTFEYEIFITVRDLDDRGFVCDNFDVPKMFNRYSEGVWQASCEQFAGGGIYLMHHLCKERAEKIICRIRPLKTATDEAWTEFEWNKGDEKPDWFPKRIDQPKKKSAAKKPSKVLIGYD